MSDQKYVVATAPLFIDYTRAHNPGDLVPAENVDRNGWADGVAKLGSKAADTALGNVAATDEPTPAPVPANPPGK